MAKPGATAVARCIDNVRLLADGGLVAGRLLLVGGRVIAVGDAIPEAWLADAEVVDGGGAIALPGFIDNHVHVAGGGGAAGFASRSRPIRAVDLVGGSTTTVVGMLGFDSTTRGLRGLLGDVKGLRQHGIGAYALVGSTARHPVPTLTGSIAEDIAFIDEVIGAGEISLSELGYEFDTMGDAGSYVATVASDVVLAGRLAGVAGYVCLQVPPHVEDPLRTLFEIVERTRIPRRHFLPSHVNQSARYLEQAADWGRAGGWVDVGTGYRPDRGFRHAIDPREAVIRLIDGGVPPDRILLSSDGNGVVPDSSGQPVYMELSTLQDVWRGLVRERGVDLATATALVTSNVSDFARLSTKGRLEPGRDADVVLVDDELMVQTTFVAGHRLELDARTSADGPARSAT